MEVNFVESDAGKEVVALRLQKSELCKHRGSWKAKRRAVLIERRQAPSHFVRKRKGREQLLTRDEFVSGAHHENVPVKQDETSTFFFGGEISQTRTSEDSSVHSSSHRKRQRTEFRNNFGVNQSAKVDRADSVETDYYPSKNSGKAHPVISKKLENCSIDRPDTATGQKSVDATVDIFEEKESLAYLHCNNEKLQSRGKGKDAAQGTDLSCGNDSVLFSQRTFEDVGLYKSIARHLALRLDIERLTVVQERMLQATLSAESSIDVLVRSETGSGKTLAYCLPIAHFLLNRPKRLSREDGSIGIIVVPTRELAEQVEDVASRLLRPWHWIVVGSVRGGENKKHEKDRLRKGITVLVATPGRLIDHFRNTRAFVYSKCEFLVLDEADRLLDLGFEQDIKECIKTLDSVQEIHDESKLRSNFLLSATLNKDVKQLADFSLSTPVEVNSEPLVAAGVDKARRNACFATPGNLMQHFCVVEQRYRLVTLLAFLRLRALMGMNILVRTHEREKLKCDISEQDKNETARTENKNNDMQLPTCKIIVFFSSCDSVDFHYALLKEFGRPKEMSDSHDDIVGNALVPLSAFHIHGMRSQRERVQALREFRCSDRAVLLCTDVAARGLDLKNVTFSVQYDPPTGGTGEELEYLHRAGRTARIGERGDALLFVLPSEKLFIKKLESTGASMAEISGDAALAALLPKFNAKNRENLKYNARLATSSLQEAAEVRVKSSERIKSLAYRAFQAYCRAYATHARDIKHVFHIRNLHLGHVARAFAIAENPADLHELILHKRPRNLQGHVSSSSTVQKSDSTLKADVARAIAEGGTQPFNDQRTSLARRRREGGRGFESYKELAVEFGS